MTKTIWKHIIVKLLKTRNKEIKKNILKQAEKKNTYHQECQLNSRQKHAKIEINVMIPLVFREKQ